MRPLPSAAVLGLVPIPCVAATSSGCRCDSCVSGARQGAAPQAGGNSTDERMTWSAELAQIGGQLRQVETGHARGALPQPDCRA
jgi:hypothetical protein